MTNVEILEQYPWIKRDVYDYVRENIKEEFRPNGIETYINGMSREGLLDAYLSWNGIIDWTTNIITFMDMAFSSDDTDQLMRDLRECDFENKMNGELQLYYLQIGGKISEDIYYCSNLYFMFSRTWYDYE